METITIKEITEDTEAMFRWIDEDGEKQVWEPFEDYGYDGVDDLIHSFSSNFARLLESKGVKVKW